MNEYRREAKTPALTPVTEGAPTAFRAVAFSSGIHNDQQQQEQHMQYQQQLRSQQQLQHELQRQEQHQLLMQQQQHQQQQLQQPPGLQHRHQRLAQEQQQHLPPLQQQQPQQLLQQQQQQQQPFNNPKVGEPAPVTPYYPTPFMPQSASFPTAHEDKNTWSYPVPSATFPYGNSQQDSYAGFGFLDGLQTVYAGDPVQPVVDEPLPGPVAAAPNLSPKSPTYHSLSRTSSPGVRAEEDDTDDSGDDASNSGKQWSPPEYCPLFGTKLMRRQDFLRSLHDGGKFEQKLNLHIL